MASYKPVVSDLLRCSMYSYAAAQVAINTVFYRVVSVVTGGATMDAIADDYNTQMKPLLLPMLSSEADWLGVKIAAPFVATAPVPAILDSVSAGTSGATLLPTQAAAVLTLKTEVAGPRGRGRLYLPFASTGDADADGSPDAAYRGLMGDVGAAIVLGFTGSGGGGSCALEPVIYHRSLGTSSLITNYYANDRFGTMKKRGSYGKQNPSVI